MTNFQILQSLIKLNREMKKIEHLVDNIEQECIKMHKVAA